jgi:hypothetical protein
LVPSVSVDTLRRGASVRLVLLEPCNQPVIGRLHLVFQRHCRAIEQGFAVFGVDLAAILQRLDFRLRIRQQWRVRALAKRRAGDDEAGFLNRLVIGKPRRAVALRRRKLRALDALVQRPRHLRKPGDIGFHVWLLAHLMEGDQEVRQENVRPVLHEHIGLASELRGFLREVELQRPHLEGCPSLFVEPDGIERFPHLGYALAPPGEFAVRGRV